MMRFRKVLMRVVGCFYLFAGTLNLLSLVLVEEVRLQAISLSAMTFRYVAYLVIGVGMLLLRKWSAYVLGVSIAMNWLAFFTVYEGQSFLVPWQYSLIGPVLFAMLYYFTWPVLLPKKVARPSSQVV